MNKNTSLWLLSIITVSLGIYNIYLVHSKVKHKNDLKESGYYFYDSQVEHYGVAWDSLYTVNEENRAKYNALLDSNKYNNQYGNPTTEAKKVHMRGREIRLQFDSLSRVTSYAKRRKQEILDSLNKH